MNDMEISNAVSDGSSILSEFEKQYLEIREKERQYYTDEQVSLLPDIPGTHPHYTEWKYRKISSDRLIAYLGKIKKPIKILEVGCGNGWLASKIAAISNTMVTGIDINKTELKQAASVFKNKKNLHFLYGNIQEGILLDQKFDIIVFAASIQYFPSLVQLLQNALKLLAKNGEIHILDSPLYKEQDIILAKQRAKIYFEKLGFPGMAAFYFYHKLSDLHSFIFKVLYDPFSLTCKLLKKHHPFYWVRITQMN